MRSLEKSYSMEALFRSIGKSRQDFIQGNSRNILRQARDEKVVELVYKWRDLHPKMGSRTLYYSMVRAGIDLPFGVNSFENLLSHKGLTVGKIKTSFPRTSDGKGKGRYENLTNGLRLTDINKLIVGDITYFWVESRWHYIFTLKDVYSQRIISLKPSRDMTAQNALCCLTELIDIRGRTALKGCIHHSDNGSQYNSNKYIDQLDLLGIVISRASSCQENGSSEQLNHITKNMYLSAWSISSFPELIQACKEVVYLSNNERAIKQLDYMTPIAFEKSLATVPSSHRKEKCMHDFSQT